MQHIKLTLLKHFAVSILFILASCKQDLPAIKIKGSDTEVNLAVQFAESFHNRQPGVFVSVSGGGSGLGIASLLNGTADIANSSRAINTAERSLFLDRKFQLDSFIFAQDAIAFVVSAKLPIDSISTADLAKLLSGQYKTWQTVAGINRPVNIYGRQSNSGTHDFVKDKLHIDFSQYAKQMNGNAQILQAIQQDNSGIGYVGAGYVLHGGETGVKVLLVYVANKGSAVSPMDEKSISEGKYFFQRPLYQYFKGSDYTKIKPFLDFERSSEGLQIIKDGGYYPAKKTL